MELDEYRRASRAIWERMAPGWDERHTLVEEATRPVTERIVERLAPAPGETILELAAGTGVVGFAVAQALGGRARLILSDFSPSMVEIMERRGGELGLDGIEYRVLDAERLDLPTASVDAVACRFAYMLMGDPAAAFAETRRVLRPGGRLSCSVMASAADNPWSSLIGRLMVEVGHMAPPDPAAPGIHALADPERLRALIAGAGFAEPRIEPVAWGWDFSGAEEYWTFIQEMAGDIVLILQRLAPDERERVREALGERLAPYRSPEGCRLPGSALVASAEAV